MSYGPSMAPSQRADDRYYLAPRFEDCVATHVARNLSGLDIDIPLILGMHGPAGEGKTKQCRVVITRMGLDCVLISGGELENKQAGRPGELIRDRYLEASRLFGKSKPAAVLLINDFDAGVGVWSDRFGQRTVFQYTVNLQNVYATLMNIADHPTVVDGLQCSRVPIIVTGNDFTTLYGPLMRDGRMAKFRWEPTVEEKVSMALPLFEEFPIPPGELTQFIRRHAEKPMAFFAHLRSTLTDAHIRREISRIGIGNVVSFCLSGGFTRAWGVPSITELERTAAEIQSQWIVVNRGALEN